MLTWLSSDVGWPSATLVQHSPDVGNNGSCLLGGHRSVGLQLEKHVLMLGHCLRRLPNFNPSMGLNVTYTRRSDGERTYILTWYCFTNFINRLYKKKIKSRVEGRGSRVVGRGGRGGFREIHPRVRFISVYVDYQNGARVFDNLGHSYTP